jgi:hypothetical protein
VIAIGLINVFWGNDPGFGFFLLALSLIYMPPVQKLVEFRSGSSIHWIIKLMVALFALWAALGVGELFEKIEMMRHSL